jgi:lipopolysaccharide/colanic/teichoic acid biosynthesis glycosyltransferase
MWHKILRIIEIIIGISAAVGVIAGIAQLFEKKSNKHKPKGLYESFFKRAIDAFLSTGALIVLSPIIGITAILVRIKHGSPVVYIQERPGKDEKIFKIYKFRTMTNETDNDGNLLPDEQRMTKLGAILRRTSIDEILELVNIIRGDMAIIGPRPLLVRYLSRYNEEQHHRHDVRPGLTGYAQAHGRNNVSWEDKFAMDVWYTRNVTFKNDLKILFDTVKTVFRQEGISSETSVTMEEFMGTPEGVVAEWRAPN